MDLVDLSQIKAFYPSRIFEISFHQIRICLPYSLHPEFLFTNKLSYLTGPKYGRILDAPATIDLSQSIPQNLTAFERWRNNVKLLTHPRLDKGLWSHRTFHSKYLLSS